MWRLFIARRPIAAGGVLKLFEPCHQCLMTPCPIGLRLGEAQQFGAQLFNRQRLVRHQFLEALKPGMCVLCQTCRLHFVNIVGNGHEFTAFDDIQQNPIRADMAGARKRMERCADAVVKILDVFHGSDKFVDRQVRPGVF